MKPTIIKYCYAGVIALCLSSSPLQAEELSPFYAKFDVQVAGFNLGQGVHTLSCKDQLCTLKSSAKPSGFIRNFFKDELYETSVFKQSDETIEWLSYQKRDVKYKNGEVREKTQTLRKTDDGIVSVETKQSFPYSDAAFDPMLISYAVQWLRLNQKPQADFQKLVLQTDDQQLPINFLEFATSIKLGLDFSDQALAGEKYRLETNNIEVELWILEELNWFPAKIKIFRKDKNRTIVLNLSKEPLIESN